MTIGLVTIRNEKEKKKNQEKNLKNHYYKQPLTQLMTMKVLDIKHSQEPVAIYVFLHVG